MGRGQGEIHRYICICHLYIIIYHRYLPRFSCGSCFDLCHQEPSLAGKTRVTTWVRVCSELMTTSEWTHQIRNSSYFPPTAKRKKRTRRAGVVKLETQTQSPIPSVVHILSQCEWWTASFSSSFRLPTSSHKWFKTKSDSKPQLWTETESSCQLLSQTGWAGDIFYDARRPQEL